MHRLLIALLAAVDAVIAAAVGITALLAPLTILWIFAFGADWGALWPTAATLWQFGHGVELSVLIPDEVIVAVGIDPDAAGFTLGVAPVAFLVFTALFAARSGARAARSGAWATGVAAGAAAFALISVGVALTGVLEVAQTALWQAIAFPAVVYLCGVLAGAWVTAWRNGDGGIVDAVRQWLDDDADWGPVPEAIVRGGAIAVVGVLGAGALAVTVAVAFGAAEVVALFESLRVDALGATVLTAAHLVFLPTLVIWAVAWLAGPGFAVGTGTSVSPAGTELGVVPGIPAFGILPENVSVWALVVVIIPVAAGAFAGWAVRSRIVWDDGDIPLLPRAAIAVGVAGVAAAFGAVVGALASGSIGPGRLADAGPHPGWFALALAAEVFIGAAILLLSPRHRDEVAQEQWLATEFDGSFATEAVPAGVGSVASEEDTTPVDVGFLDSARDTDDEPTR